MRRRGFTLVEIVAVMLIMSLAAVVVMPVVTVLLTRINDSQDRRAVSAQLHTALDQVTRVVREWPSENGELEGLVATRDGGDLVGLQIPGSGGFVLSSGELRLLNASGDEGLLCAGIDDFTVTVLGRDSDSPLLTDPDLLAGVTVRLDLEAEGCRVSGIVFVRSAGGNS